MNPTCIECERTFDLQDSIDADEWTYGHDCELAAATVDSQGGR